MGLFSKDEPLTAATVRSFDRIPDRPVVDALRDGDLWRIYRCVPEVHYAVNQQARLVGRLEWRVEFDGEEMPQGEEIMRRAFGSDLRSIAVMAAIHLQVVGRFWLVRTPSERGGTWRILNSPLTSEQKKVAEQADILVEVLIEDPAIPNRADSPVAAIRDIATELILTRAQARATARSRTAQTMMVLYPKEGAGPNSTKFENELAKIITEPLSDEKAASVAVPNMIGFPADFIEKWRVLDLTGPIDERLHDRVDKLIRQLAIGLDIAPSVLLGLEDSNQWSAYASLEDNWLGHVEPLAAPVGQAFAEGLAKAANLDRDRIEVIPDPAPLLRRRPAISDVIQAAQLGIVTFAWAAEQLGAPDDATGDGVPQDEAPALEGATEEPQLEQAPETRQITGGPTTPRVAAHTPSHTIDGARLADIDDQAYTSLEDLILDIAERALEKLGAKIRSMAQGRNIDLPPDVPNVELARQFTGEIPNRDATIDQVATAAIAKVTRVITRAQGRLRAMGIEVPPEPEQEGLTAAQAAFITAVAATVAAQQEGGTGIAEAWEAARQVATIAGGGEAADFRQAASGIALAAATLSIIRRDFGLAPPTGPASHRWLHLYQGPDPHPVHLSLKDALFDGVSVFAGGYVAFPGDHAGCQCIAAPADMVNVRTGWSQLQPAART
jgi:hypothetical protein